LRCRTWHAAAGAAAEPHLSLLLQLLLCSFSICMGLLQLRRQLPYLAVQGCNPLHLLLVRCQ
jgi:hypothetical protein